MRRITEQEYNELLYDTRYGVDHFMGGCNSDAPNIIYLVGNEHIVFTREEIEKKTPEYLEVIEKQNQEAKEFFESYNNRG